MHCSCWHELREGSAAKAQSPNFGVHRKLCTVSCSWLALNNNNGHFYGAWSLARSRAQCAVQKAAEKCLNTYSGHNKKGFRPYDCQPRKNLHTAISVNKPKLLVTKHDQTLILARMYDTSRYTANTKMYSGISHARAHTHTHTHAPPPPTHTQVGWGWGINYMQIWRDEFLRLAWKMFILSDEHDTVTSSTVSGPWKKKLVVQRSLS